MGFISDRKQVCLLPRKRQLRREAKRISTKAATHWWLTQHHGAGGALATVRRACHRDESERQQAGKHEERGQLFHYDRSIAFPRHSRHERRAVLRIWQHALDPHETLRFLSTIDDSVSCLKHHISNFEPSPAKAVYVEGRQISMFSSISNRSKRIHFVYFFCYSVLRFYRIPEIVYQNDRLFRFV